MRFLIVISLLLYFSEFLGIFLFFLFGVFPDYRESRVTCSETRETVLFVVVAASEVT